MISQDKYVFAVVDSTVKCTSTSTFWFVAWSLYSWVEEDIVVIFWSSYGDEDIDEDAWSGTTSSCC